MQMADADRPDGAQAVALPLPKPGEVGTVLARIRADGPRVHCSINSVAQLFVANVLVALGAEPSMTTAVDEIAPLVESAGALLVNLGTLDSPRRDGINRAVTVARDAGRPWVLDPVKVDRVPHRLGYARSLLRGRPTIVKANAAEAAALRAHAGLLARSDAVLLTSGDEDRLEVAGRTILARNGTPLLARVIATGCALGAVVAAASAVERDPLLAALAGLAIFTIAAELAAEGDPGPGTFAVRLIDALGAIGPADVERRARWADA